MPDSAPLAIVTGATNGLGRAAAETLARRGYRLCLVARDPARAAAAADEIAAATGAPAPRIFLADLSEVAEVRRVGEEIHALDEPIQLLLNNAGGVFGVPRAETSDGFERTFALNHLAYFQLTLRLLDRLEQAAPARIINVASNAFAYAGGRFDFDDPHARRRYRPHRQYGASKLANILFTHELARRIEGTGVTTLAWSPAGLTATRFAYSAGRVASLFMKLTHPFALATEDAVVPLVEYCRGPLEPSAHGRFFFGDREMSVPTCNDEDARRLWALSARLTGVGA